MKRKLKKNKTAVAALAAAATLAVGTLPSAMITSSAVAADTSTNTITVTPNPWYANGPFDGWGTSLAWFANATGNYGEEGFVTNRDQISDEAYQKALAKGKELRQEFYNSIFGEQGLDLNMARYNIGGGNASDVAYGFPFMRQGAAVPGYWADDPTGSKNLYGGTATTQANKDAIAEAFNPTNTSQYDWSKGKAQEWWLKQGHTTGDITHIEAFANSAPWFLTSSGYATGGYNSGSNNLQDATKFAQYLATVTKHLEQQYGITINTLEPFNEAETSYWGTPNTYANGSYDATQTELINRYWQRMYSNKDKSVTPYTTATKKPQEGMHVDNAHMQETLRALAAAMGSNSQTKLVATDATDSGQLVDSYNAFPQEIRNLLGQYNTHSYGTNNQRVVRDIAQTDGKQLSMSEVDGAWQSGGFNPYEFSNGLGMARKINSDIYALQSKDFNFWQVVEDLYNMATSDTDMYGNTANPKGENTNWGTVFISFDCTVADNDGNLYSQRDVDNNGGKTDGLKPCTVLVNSKYNAVRAYTKFIHEGDAIIANNRTTDTLTATSSDGTTQSIIHTNSSDAEQTFVIDLSKYGKITDNASGTLYLTSAPTRAEGSDAYFGATPQYMNTFSNVKQDDAVHIDAAAKTATVTVPARSIASITLSGITGVAADAGIAADTAYELVGQGSGKTLTEQSVGDSALSIQDEATTADGAKKQTWTFHEVAAPNERPTQHRYVITDASNAVLVSSNGTNALKAMSVEDATNDPTAQWVVNTEDGAAWSLVNVAAQRALDVDGQSKAAGTKVGLWLSGGGQHQAWYVRSVKPIAADDVTAHTAVGKLPLLPETVQLQYEWGVGQSAAVQWNTDGLAEAVTTEGTVDVSGTATTTRGDSVPVTAHVHVGAFTVTDPASLTVGVQSTADQVRAKLPQTVQAHVSTSPSFDTPVIWNEDDIAAALTQEHLSQAGMYTIRGVADNGTDSTDANARAASDNNNTIPAMLTLYITERNTASNIAPEHAKASASSTESGYSATNTIDGKLNTNWSNWRSGGGDTHPWLQYDLDDTYPIDEVHYYVDQNRAEAAVSKIDVQIPAADGTWTTVATTSDIVTAQGKPTVIALPEGTTTRSVRLSLTYGTKASEDYFTKTAEVQLMAKVNNDPAGDAALGDLRIDGTQIASFTPEGTSYNVKLAENAKAYPLVQAFARDTAATVNMEQPTVDNGGKATIRVTSADGKATQTTVVDFGTLPTPNESGENGGTESSGNNSGSTDNSGTEQPGHTQAGVSHPSDTQSGDAQPDAAQSGDAQSGDAQSGNKDSAHADAPLAATGVNVGVLALMAFIALGAAGVAIILKRKAQSLQ